MATIKPTAFRFTAEDLALLAALQAKLGILSRSDVLRMAIRELAKAHGVVLPGAKLAANKSGLTCAPTPMKPYPKPLHEQVSPMSLSSHNPAVSANPPGFDHRFPSTHRAVVAIEVVPSAPAVKG